LFVSFRYLGTFFGVYSVFYAVAPISSVSALKCQGTRKSLSFIYSALLIEPRGGDEAICLQQ
jgi:hypothetical protein